MESVQYAALPQRPQRERRSRKRAKVDDAEEGAPVTAAGGAPPAAGGEQQPARQPAELQQAALQAEQQGQPHPPAGGQQPQQPQQQGEPQEAAGEHEAGPAATQLDLPAYRSAAVRGHKFEYLDHTADVQLHAWGETLREAFENCALAMFNYMTPLKGIGIDPALTRRYEAEGHDLQSLLFNFLDELLFAFATEFFVAKRLRITRFDRGEPAQQAQQGGGEGGSEGGGGWRIEAEGEGETFDRQRHACGTEVKAITYSAMQINEQPDDAEVFVIVDI